MSDSIQQEIEKQTRASEHELLEQLLDPKVQESLSILVKELPKLTELLTLLSDSYDTVKSLATDEVLKSDTVEAITEMIEPIKSSVKNVAATAIEAKDEAEESTEVIGIFGLLRILKDPEAQKLFRFVNAYLKVAAERNNQ
ncbi:DUF1641 domain-containing protein [Gracilibacillus sp. YIM 98692]|uniref:DUF1641 domain-containing protein n=1 Tax=Gracilibacillus sp. YIM 98692 TaxID=2663532 RepID=UPI0013D07045|nr:DUF1641 domain-containing protein [Gracilibacillus sp. YIM 98692]